MSAALATALRLNNLAVAAAQRDLAEAFNRETQAGVKLAYLSTAIARELAASSSLTAADDSVDALAAWLPKARAEQTAARAALFEASTASAHARALVVAARSAEAAVESLIDRRRQLLLATSQRRDDTDIEDISRGLAERA